ncbi:MAG TPA: nucleoside-diphosphate sugar epimerase, partial [Ruminococcaceae bacterium]|nr:nucleoside-diphosphate sugar epimerase [Oscillospiraceae bacterium]
MLESQTVLVTGAGGYIGRHVVQKLLDAGASVIAADLHTDRVDSRAKHINANVFSGDPAIYQQLGSPDICLHLAWKDGFVHNSPVHMTLLSSHFEFLYNMIAGGLKHVAVMGTMHEVGYHEGAITANTPTSPMSLY